MVSPVVLGVLAFGHVLGATGWLGGGLLTTFVLAPNLRKLQPAAGLEFNAKVLPRIVRFVQAMIGITFLFGALLLYFFVGGDSAFFATRQGIELSIGVGLALVTAIVAWTVTFPSFKQVVKIAKGLSQGGQPPPELMRYARRARMGSLVGVTLLLVVLATMVFAGSGLY